MFGLLNALNLGEQVFTAAVLALIAWYLIRGKSAAGTIVGILGTITTVVLGVLAVLVVSIGLGWFDPQPGVFIAHATSAIRVGLDLGREVLLDWIMGLIP